MTADPIPRPETVASASPPNITPFPPPPPEDTLSKLLKNPLVIAGGALLAGMALTRLFSTSPMRKWARDVAEEALKRTRTTGEPTTGSSILEQGLEAIRPEVTDAARRIIADVFRRS